MTFEDSPFYSKYTHVKKEFDFGNFYLCDNFYISEIFEGVHFDWFKVEQLVDVLLEFYGIDCKIAWISNRINSYSIDPHTWIKFHKKYDFLVAGAIIVYNEVNYLSASVEKMFAQVSLKRCTSLGEGFEWIKQIKEFN